MASSTPTQVRAVDPFASYNSDTVNKLTRIINLGEDCLENARACDVVLDSTSTSKVVVKPGVVYKDDVWIDITTQHTVDFDDYGNQYYSFNPMKLINGYYYIVLSYTYQRQRPAPEAEILIVMPGDIHLYTHGGDWLLLKVVNVTVGPIVVNSILSYDPITPTNRRIIATEYAGTEIALPPFDSLRDPSRLVFVENENTYYFGLNNGWSLPIGGGGSGGAGSVVEMNTIGFSIGDLVYITPTGNIASATSSLQSSTADGVVTSIGITGLVQMSGKVFNVTVESGDTALVGSLLYLSKNEPGSVRTTATTPYHQFVGRCVDVVTGTTVNMFFVRGEPNGSGTSEYCTYVETILSSSGWIGSGPYYQDVDITDISGVSSVVSVWNTNTELEIEPEDIEFVSTSIMRIWMSTNTENLQLLAIGPSSAVVTTSNIADIYVNLPSDGWFGAGPYYQDIDVSSIDLSQSAIVLARDTATDLKVKTASVQFDSTNNLRIWMPNNITDLDVSVQGPTSTSTSIVALTTILPSGGSWVSSGGSYYQDINVNSFGDNHVTIECVDNTTDMVIEPEDIEFISSTVVRIWMSTNVLQLNITVIG